MLLDCLDCENVHHTGKNDCFEVAVASVHTFEEDSHGHSADKTPGMVPCRVADIANHHNTRSAHTARRNRSVRRGDRGKHWGLVECTHHSLHFLGQLVHLLCLFVVLHICSLQSFVAVEVPAALGVDNMAVSTWQRSLASVKGSG